jgi:hypothetical protein
MANKLNNLTIFKRNVSNNSEQVNRAISDVQSIISAKIIAHNNAVAKAKAEAEAESKAKVVHQTQAKKHKVIINKSVILNNVNVI